MTNERLRRELRQAIDRRDHVAEVYLRQRMQRQHEAHGGDESPDRDNCYVCQQAIDDFLRWGAMRTEIYP